MKQVLELNAQVVNYIYVSVPRFSGFSTLLDLCVPLLSIET